MLNDFEYLKASLISPWDHAFEITPSDANDLPHVTRAFAIGGAGDLEVITFGGEHVTIPDGVLNTGVEHPGRITRVLATGTTATDIWGFY